MVSSFHTLLSPMCSSKVVAVVVVETVTTSLVVIQVALVMTLVGLALALRRAVRGAFPAVFLMVMRSGTRWVIYASDIQVLSFLFKCRDDCD